MAIKAVTCSFRQC